MIRSHHTFSLTALFVLFISCAVIGAANPECLLSGVVTDSHNRPVWGATVTVRDSNHVVAATSADSLGHFQIFVTPCPATALSITASSVGYTPQTLAVADSTDHSTLQLTLSPALIELPAIRVQTSAAEHKTERVFGTKQIAQASAASLIPSNPTAALSFPDLARVGSSHSSQIRVNGAAPTYFLNGMPIGSDPNHFGAFSIVPAAMVQTLQFLPQGTDVAYGTPAAVGFRTPSGFKRQFGGELSLSTIDADLSCQAASDRFFVLGSVRKSILDKIVRQFDLSSNRRTIPPTNFQDIFVTSGARLSASWQLLLDHYYVRDYLSYNTASVISNESGTQTSQAIHERYFGTRLQRVSGSTRLLLSGAVKKSERQYVATPEYESPNNVLVDLKETALTYLAQCQLDRDIHRVRTTTGYSLESTTECEVTMHQRNWNFLSPFAGTDNPFVYQRALNTTFGHYEGDSPQLHTAAYASIEYPLGKLTVSSGLRLERISRLKRSETLLQRHSITLRTGSNSECRLHYGTYVENPVSAILEPYQILVRSSLNDLTPIRTQLITADYFAGPVRIGLFRKWIDHLPAVSPDFEHVYISPGHLNPEFLRMRSVGKSDFYGASVDLSLERFIWSSVALHGSYSLSHATTTELGVTFPYDLYARHRLQMRLEYKATRVAIFGAELQMRSGYPYSPYRAVLTASESSSYSEDYYRSVLENENSRTFKTNGYLNLSSRFVFGRAELSVAVTNVTNRSNPIISSATGLIYDAGIMPSIGMKWKF